MVDKIWKIISGVRLIDDVYKSTYFVLQVHFILFFLILYFSLALYSTFLLDCTVSEAFRSFGASNQICALKTRILDPSAQYIDSQSIV